jgi:hypothetical protein
MSGRTAREMQANEECAAAGLRLRRISWTRRSLLFLILIMLLILILFIFWPGLLRMRGAPNGGGSGYKPS